jgi:hypothetical protein
VPEVETIRVQGGLELPWDKGLLLCGTDGSDAAEPEPPAEAGWQAQVLDLFQPKIVPQKTGLCLMICIEKVAGQAAEGAAR